MLRIRKEYDLKNLEKLGFTFLLKNFGNSDFYFKKVYLANDDDDRVCYRINVVDRIIKMTRIDGELDNTLYDLITTYIDLDNKQASIVERVDN